MFSPVNGIVVQSHKFPAGSAAFVSANSLDDTAPT